MGAMTFITEDDALLRAKHTASDTPDCFDGVVDVSKNRWLGAWYNCFGDCGRTSWLACLLTGFMPCLSSGLTVRRGLKENIFLHVALYITIFIGVHVAGCMLQSVYARENSIACDMGMDAIVGRAGASQQQLPAACEALLPWVVGRYLADAVAAIVGAMWLARRRTAIRKKFGIAGSRCRDFWLMCCCQLCALAQEYRTMVHNNVHEGVWRGAGSRVADTCTEPPTNQFMV